MIKDESTAKDESHKSNLEWVEEGLINRIGDGNNVINNRKLISLCQNYVGTLMTIDPHLYHEIAETTMNLLIKRQYAGRVKAENEPQKLVAENRKRILMQNSSTNRSQNDISKLPAGNTNKTPLKFTEISLSEQNGAKKERLIGKWSTSELSASPRTVLGKPSVSLKNSISVSNKNKNYADSNQPGRAITGGSGPFSK
jgi:hypothetical protein